MAAAAPTAVAVMARGGEGGDRVGDIRRRPYIPTVWPMVAVLKDLGRHVKHGKTCDVKGVGPSITCRNLAAHCQSKQTLPKCCLVKGENAVSCVARYRRMHRSQRSRDATSRRLLHEQASSHLFPTMGRNLQDLSCFLITIAVTADRGTIEHIQAGNRGGSCNRRCIYGTRPRRVSLLPPRGCHRWQRSES